MEQMMQQVFAFFQKQQAMQQRFNVEERIQKTRQSMIKKLGHFDGHDISKFFQAYKAMDTNGIENLAAIEGFHIITTPQSTRTPRGTQ